MPRAILVSHQVTMLATQPIGGPNSRTQAEPASVRQYMTRHRERLIEAMNGGREYGMALAREHSDLADELVRTVFAYAHAGREGAPVLLGAVGGFGRRLLGLQSDLDLCFVTTERPENVSATVEAVLYPLWDANIKVGHQIVWPSDVADEASADLAMATELLDFRPLAGDVSLMHTVRQRLGDSIFSEARIESFIAQLEARAKQRHEQFGDSVYLLEPDIKNGTGGLRDLDVALWACRARFGTSDLLILQESDVLTEQARIDTERALEFLWTVRNHLHAILGRKTDRLTFAAQEAVARAMGYAPEKDASVPELQRTGEMIETFMSDYYRHARVITHTRDRLLGRAKRRRTGPRPVAADIGDGLVQCEGGVGVADFERLDRDPALAFRVYIAALARHVPVLSRTRDAIACASANPDFCVRLRDSQEAAALFMTLVCTSRTVAFASRSVLAELHDVGLLLAMLPEFSPVVGRVHHDMYHVYTVDVHSIAAVDRLHALRRGDLAVKLPLASHVAAEATRPKVLFMATLLHDVGKAIGGRNHAERGADMARSILGRLGFAQEEVEDVCHLIRHHLTMYMVAVRRDLGDPTTVAEFVRHVRGREGLRELYLLTVADVSTTSPVAMTKWKRSMLDGLFRASDAFLAGIAAKPSDRLARVRTQARALWRDPGTREQFEHFLQSMPARYFLANSPEDVLAHAELALRPRRGSVGVSLVPSKHEGMLGLCVVAEGQRAADLCVVASDRPGLLAAIAAAIAAHRFDIQAAQINTRPLPSGGYQAVDLFWVRSTRHDETTDDCLNALERDLARVVSGEVLPQALVKSNPAPRWIAKRTPPVSTDVVFDHHASEQYSVIEVLAEDAPALLFKLATVLNQLGITIGVAKISTEGTRAVDVFYATEVDGSKIAPGPRTEEIRAKLIASLQKD